MDNYSKSTFSLNSTNLNDEAYLTLAIQTVLYNNRQQLLSLPDSLSDEHFLQEMSREIMRRASKFKQVAEAAAKRIDIGRVYDVKGEAVECTTRLKMRN